MRGYLIGAFGSNAAVKEEFLGSIAKRAESEGVVVYGRVESGARYSFLDDPGYPEKIQGYARIASICDYAQYLFPVDGTLRPMDGELAILVDSFALDGAVQVVDGSADAVSDVVRRSFTGLGLSRYPVLERSSNSSAIDLSFLQGRPSSKKGTLVYVDRVFNVKGVGLVALGFVLSGKVSVHDELRPTPGTTGKSVEVRGIQISDEDYDEAPRGIRVGLSLKGVELKDMEKTSWMDDGSFSLSKSLRLDFKKSPYYRQDVADRDLHLQCNGETIPAHLTLQEGTTVATLPAEIPSWTGMRIALLDLNSKTLRVVGGGIVLA